MAFKKFRGFPPHRCSFADETLAERDLLGAELGWPAEPDPRAFAAMRPLLVNERALELGDAVKERLEAPSRERLPERAATPNEDRCRTNRAAVDAWVERNRVPCVGIVGKRHKPHKWHPYGRSHRMSSGRVPVCGVARR